jgi:hypothetical protein
MNTTVQTALIYIGAAFIILLEATVFWKIATDRIKLDYLIADDNGDASLSRFQLLIFTFVISIGMLYLIFKGDAFPDIDEGVLVLLGISGASYALGKTIDKQPGPLSTVTQTTVTTSTPEAPKGQP